MARANEKRISYREQDRLVRMLSDIFARLGSGGKIFNFLKDLLNRQERLMLARRILIAELLLRGHTYVRIHDVLGAAPDTIARIEKRLHFGRRGLLEAISAKKKNHTR